MAEFSSLNGYDVKDATARGKITNDIEPILKNHTLTLSNLYLNNVSELKNITTLIVGDVVKTLGYYEVCDGGSGLYVITDTCPDEEADGIEYIALQNNLFARLMIEENTIKVKQMGVKENESIKNAVDYCTAKGLNLYLNGSKFITEHFEVHYNLIGDNTELEFTGTTGMSIFGSNLLIEGITLNHNHFEGSTLYISNSCKDVIVRRCTFINAGLEAISTGYRMQENILITECVFKDYGRCGIAVIGVDGMNIINNTFYDGLETSNFAIDIEPFEDGMTAKNITIENNRIIHHKTAIKLYGYPAKNYGTINIGSNLIEAENGVAYAGSFSSYDIMPVFNIYDNRFNCTAYAIMCSEYSTTQNHDSSKLVKCVNNEITGGIKIQGREIIFNSNAVYWNTETVKFCIARGVINGNYFYTSSYGLEIGGRNQNVQASISNNVCMGAPSPFVTTKDIYSGSNIVQSGNNIS